MDCLFCKIVNGTIPAKMVFEDDRAIAFLNRNTRRLHVGLPQGSPRVLISRLLPARRHD